MHEASVIILAGGRNRRMGQVKAFLEVGDGNLIENTMAEVAPYFKEIIVVSNEPELYRREGLKITSDRYPGFSGPLAGIHAGLLVAECPLALVLACDMPFVDARVACRLVDLAGNYDVVVPKIGDYLEPLFAVYSRRCLVPIESALAAGKKRVISFYHEVLVRYVESESLLDICSPDIAFFNVNTPSDLKMARSLAEENRGSFQKMGEDEERVSKKPTDKGR